MREWRKHAACKFSNSEKPLVFIQAEWQLGCCSTHAAVEWGSGMQQRNACVLVPEVWLLQDTRVGFSTVTDPLEREISLYSSETVDGQTSCCICVMTAELEKEKNLLFFQL